jgi:hypothetical protein
MELKILPNVPLQPFGPASREALACGLTTFLQAAEHVANLPYGRNTDRADFHLVLNEHRGTCSTKHAFLAALAEEQQLDVRLVLAIYEMNDGNTPGVAAVLERYGLRGLPEAHCVLLYKDQIIDLTMPPDKSAGNGVREYFFKEVMRPEGIGNHKIEVHRQILAKWLLTEEVELSLEDAWRIREDCIHALSAIPTVRTTLHP